MLQSSNDFYDCAAYEQNGKVFLLNFNRPKQKEDFIGSVPFGCPIVLLKSEEIPDISDIHYMRIKEADCYGEKI